MEKSRYEQFSHVLLFFVGGGGKGNKEAVAHSGASMFDMFDWDLKSLKSLTC